MHALTAPPPQVSSADRLGVTAFFAVLAHLIVILGVTFSPEDRPRHAVETLDVVLVPLRSETAPEHPDYLAQANRDGGGDSTERVRPTTPPTSPAGSYEPDIAAIGPASTPVEPVPVPAADDAAPPPPTEPEQPRSSSPVSSDGTAIATIAPGAPFTEPIPAGTSRAEAVPVEAVPVEAVPVETVPVETVPVESVPVESVPVEAVPVEAVPVDAAPVEAVPVDAAPVETVPVDAAPVEAVPVEAVPVEAAPVDAVPVEAAPVDAVPVEAVQNEAIAREPATAEAVLIAAEPPASLPAVEPARVELGPGEGAPGGDGSSPASFPAPVPDAEAEARARRALAMAALRAEIERDLRAYAERPRRKWISASTREHRFAAYMDAWRRKVEQVGNRNYPEEAERRGLTGDLLLDVAIRPDGTVEDITLRRSSGERILDDAAIRIVEIAAPFAEFPKDIAEDVDILHIQRTWIFHSGRTTTSR